eukprot:3301597-Pleurochrysis_carterae.AAC.2
MGAIRRRAPQVEASSPSALVRKPLPRLDGCAAARESTGRDGPSRPVHSVHRMQDATSCVCRQDMHAVFEKESEGLGEGESNKRERWKGGDANDKAERETGWAEEEEKEQAQKKKLWR